MQQSMLSPVTNTLNGEVVGCVLKAKHENANDVYCYRGIPYAEPPTGKLRFLPPKPYKRKWSEVRQCIEYSNAPLVPLPDEMKQTCTPTRPHLPNLTLKYSEDCLYLDVYTPNLDRDANLPVMFFVYGGNFQHGCNATKDGTSLAGINDVIVVIPNYRVNIFGFLSLGHSKCPGNAGLFDQQLALKWVKSNISYFGGNSNNVTIFGISAGSKAVGYHVDSPLSTNLFHKAIFHSGTSTSLVLSDNYRRTCLDFLLEKLNISQDDEEILYKLQQVDSKLLLDICQVMISKWLLFQPVLDGVFIKNDPRDVLKKKEFNTLPFILGYNDSEGMGLLSYSIPRFCEGLHETVLDELLKVLLGRFLPLNNDLDDVIQEIKSYYLKKYDGDDKTKYSKVYGSLVGDINYAIPTLRHLQAYSKFTPTYAYFGCFQPRLFHDKDYNQSAGIIPSFCNCDHANDLLLTFGAPFRHNLQENVKFSDDEKVASLNFMRFLTNFARNGDPNVGRSVPCVWPRYEETQKQTLIIRPKMTASENCQDELLDFYKFL